MFNLDDYLKELSRISNECFIYTIDGKEVTEKEFINYVLKEKKENDKI